MLQADNLTVIKSNTQYTELKANTNKVLKKINYLSYMLMFFAAFYLVIIMADLICSFPVIVGVCFSIG